MKKTVRWCLTIAAIAATVGFVTISGPSPALGCWPRPFAKGGLFGSRRTCPPIVVETCVPIQAKEPVKEPPLPQVDRDLRVNVKNLAELLKQGNPARATKYAQAVAPTIDEIATLERLQWQI